MNDLIEGSELKIESISSHSSFSAIMPPMFFDDNQRVNQVKEYERMHSSQAPYV
jgi:hypothetical protein